MAQDQGALSLNILNDSVVSTPHTFYYMVLLPFASSLRMHLTHLACTQLYIEQQIEGAGARQLPMVPMVENLPELKEDQSP